jgi:hypothetical protein
MTRGRDQPPRVVRIVSGGQTGADRAALEVAVLLGLPYGGWCPLGGWAEDLPEPPGVLALFPGLRETDTADPTVRTRLNVRDSDATLVVAPSASASPGTDLTIATAARLRRPWLSSAGAADEVVAWLRSLEPGLTLNVAGPRESELPGTHDRTRELLLAVLREADGRCSLGSPP